MLIALNATAQGEGTLQLGLSVGRETEIKVCFTDRLANRSFYQRLLIELAADAAGGAVQGGSYLDVRVRLGAWPRLIPSTGLGQKIVLQEVVDGLGCLALAYRNLRLPY